MNVFIAGMPRSGSMWLYNVTRSLLVRSNKNVFPDDIPPDETELIIRALASEKKGNEIYCIKTHHLLKPNLPDSKIICSYRDIREVIVSYMNFVRCDFNHALKEAKTFMKMIDYYFEAHNDNIIRIQYESILSNPKNVIGKITQLLKIKVVPKDIKVIIKNNSAKNVKKHIDSFSNLNIKNGEISDIISKKNFVTVKNIDGSFRVYHKKTAYQTNHITGKGKRWKEELNNREKKKLLRIATPWLKKYNYVI